MRPDIYGKIGTSGVSICTLDDVKVLYGGFDLCAPDHLGFHDHQRPGAHHAGHVSEHGHRSAGGQIQSRKRPGARPEKKPNRSGPSVLSNVRGTVQADILKEDQGQNTCIFSIDFALKMMGDIQAIFHRPQGPQFLLGLHLRLPYRRSRRQPHHPAGLYPGQRVHLRGILPVPGHAHRQLCPQSLLFLLQRHGSGIHGHRPGGPPHLGRWP